MRAAFLSAFFLPAIVGCAELRTEYTPATGQPMQVFDRTVLRTGTQRVATGQDEVRDQYGNLVATNTHYENQQVSWTEREWFPLQGNARIDDESFYRITGDQEAAQNYVAFHHGGVSRNFIGWIVTAVGLAALGGGVAAYAIDTPKDLTAGDGSTIQGERSGLSTVGYVGMLAGGITAIVGLTLVLTGKSAAHNPDARLYDDPERVKSDAARYNAALGDAAPVPPSRPAAPVAASAGPAISIAPFTASMTKDKPKKVELKADGSIFADGKKIAVINGTEVDDTSGARLFTVLADGSLKSDGPVPMRLQPDGLEMGDSTVTVADDGTIVVVKKTGVETLGKIEQGSKDKRTAVLVLAAVATINARTGH